MADKKKVPEDLRGMMREIAPYMGLGIQLAATVGIMVAVGYYLDKKLNTSPYLIVIFSFLGIITALYQFIKTVIKSDK